MAAPAIVLSVALAASPAPFTVEPEPPPPSGMGLITSGAIVATALVGVRTTYTVLNAVAASCEPNDSGDGCEDVGLVVALRSMAADGATAVLAPISIGLLAGGLWRHGRYLAHMDLATASPLRSRKALHTRRIVGWSLVASGATVWLTTTLTGWFACGETIEHSDACALGLRDGGFFAGAAMVGAGLSLAPLAGGYARGLDAAGHARRIDVAPLVSARLTGLAVSGRF